MLSNAALLLLVAAVNAHYSFPSLSAGSSPAADWSNVRKTANWQTLDPVQDVTDAAMRCYEQSPGTAASTTTTVAAGSTVEFAASPSIYHPGPLQFYMAKAPSGQTAGTMKGDGAVWFKIQEDHPGGFGTQALTWPSENVKNPSVTIPSCIAPGDYLLRVEHIGLHVAQSVGGAQFYLSCAQLTVTGGGSKTPSNLVAFPGAYKATDPGILIGIYYPVPTNYTNPGPPVFTC